MKTQVLRYLDRAMEQLSELGLIPTQTQEAPVLALIEKLAQLDEIKSASIARTLTQASTFNDLVRTQVSQMSIGERYKEITTAFDSIRNDAKRMVEQLDDGKIDTFERLGNIWMKVTRGDVSDRFEKIKKTYLEVAKDSADQIEREELILGAYRDFRGALKGAEILALEILDIAKSDWERAKGKVDLAVQAVESAQESQDLTQRAKLELARDEALRELQISEERYQIAKDLAENLQINYYTSEVIMSRLHQTNEVKKRIYQQSVTFFSTNETVLAALSASFTGLFGLHESTQTLEAMKEGISKSLEDLGEIGNAVQESALRAGYGPTIRAESVKRLVESIVSFQERTVALVDEMRKLSEQNAHEIRQSVETSKNRLSRMLARGEKLPEVAKQTP